MDAAAAFGKDMNYFKLHGEFNYHSKIVGKLAGRTRMLRNLQLKVFERYRTIVQRLQREYERWFRYE